VATTVKLPEEAKVIAKASTGMFLVELKNQPGYGCLISLKHKIRTRVMKVEAFPKWATLNKVEGVEVFVVDLNLYKEA
jgi:hypothetical protein